MRISVRKVCLKMCFVFIIISYLPPAVGSRRRHKSNRVQYSHSDNDNDLYTKQDIRRSKSNIYDLPDDDDDDTDETSNNYVPDELFNYSATDKEVEKVRRKRIDPKGSWLTFVNRMEEKKPEKKRKKRRRNKKTNENILLGPPGPAGPPGPQGPPGKSFTKEEIIKELEELIKAEAEKRAKEMLADMTPIQNKTYIPLQDDSVQHLNVPRIYSGFSMRLGSKTRVRRKTFMEIKSFQQPFGGGSFQRGETFNVQQGRFFAPRDGVYQFTANLHIRLRTKRKIKGKPKLDDYLRVVICIDSLCKTNTSIETITGVHIDNKILTATVSGFLQLQERQYTSLYVDNSSSYNLIVMVGSEYSGIFLGI